MLVIFSIFSLIPIVQITKEIAKKGYIAQKQITHLESLFFDVALVASMKLTRKKSFFTNFCDVFIFNTINTYWCNFIM